MSTQAKTKLLFIGWDGADWKIIHHLVDGGKMPNMAKFINDGVIGNLATLYPELSPMLWTSIATGKRPTSMVFLGSSNQTRKMVRFDR
jgi:predicted AlkP superfamily phosphohydrolase/phosphomutase